jgi:hypothetical protein
MTTHPGATLIVQDASNLLDTADVVQTIRFMLDDHSLNLTRCEHTRLFEANARQVVHEVGNRVNTIVSSAADILTGVEGRTERDARDEHATGSHL